MSARIRRFRLLFIGVTAGVFMALLPVTSASAATAAIHVSPATGISGRNVSVSGTGWPGNDSVRIDLDGTTSSFMCQIPATSAGVLNTQTCLVPISLPAGSYTLTASDSTSHTATTPFKVNPGITALGFTGAALINAAAGQTIGLTGSGFAPNSALHATFNAVNAPLTPAATTTASGQFSATGIVIPAATPAGRYAVVVHDSASPAHSATIHVTVFAATLTATPTAGAAGSTFTVDGSGYPANDSVRIELNQGATQNTVCFTTTDGNGELSQSCTVPTNLVQGKYNVVAEDNSLSVLTPFTLNPGIAVTGFAGSPIVNAAAGQTVGISGNGFGANSAIHATFNAATVAVTPATTTNSNGQFSGGTITIPAATTAGNYPLLVKDSSGHSVTVHLAVYAATLTVTPTTGASGTSFTVRGTGYPSFDSLRIELNQGTTQTTVCFATTDGDGVLGAKCTTPTNMVQGKYTVVAEDNSLAVSAAFTLNPGVTALGFVGSPLGNAAPGQAVGLNGSGFAANSAVHATFNGVNAVLSPATSTSSNGQFSGTSFTVPAATTAGTYPLVVRDSGGHSATINITVYAATLTATPNPGIAGSSFTVSGAGYPSNDSIRLELIQGAVQTTICFATTDGDGNLLQSCTVPTNQVQGNYTLVAEDNSLAVSTPFTLNPSIAVLNSSSAPEATAAPGSAALLTGNGFAAGSSITKLTIGTTTVSFTGGAPATSSNGTLASSAFTVPASLAAGSYTVTAKDASGNTATATLNVT